MRIVTVSQLCVGDRVHVRYPGGAGGEGVVFFVRKGYTAARTDDGRRIKIGCGATIDLITAATPESRFAAGFSGAKA